MSILWEIIIKLANLTISKEELVVFQKEMDYEGASLSDVFANLYLYYLTEGKEKKLILIEERPVFLSTVMRGSKGTFLCRLAVPIISQTGD